MAVEDAAVLGVLFSKIESVTEIPDLLRAYQVIRAPRTAATLHASLLNRTTFHLPDGADQERRDQSMKASMEDALRRDTRSEHVGNANQWADRQKNGEQFDYDAEEAARAWLKSEDAIQQAQVKL
ncbi:hypothetical protein AAF712_009824 [Marasmius tenuissimus]|uniref:Uncharacterized protein n=1 Tax=Marasmius tenuissimus TaxID=585030 RepID=A0ABR2ZQQ2_9AGAR